ncbi:hypothetical protein MBANPS3_000411 [Mucor bainieri]
MSFNNDAVVEKSSKRFCNILVWLRCWQMKYFLETHSNQCEANDDLVRFFRQFNITGIQPFFDNVPQHIQTLVANFLQQQQAVQNQQQQEQSQQHHAVPYKKKKSSKIGASIPFIKLKPT